MLKLQLARALQLPRDTRAEQGMALLRELDEDQPVETPPGAPTPSAASADRTCDQLIAMLRARLASR
jgi:hypothetical protein